MGKVEDECDIGVILTGKGIVDLKIDLAAQTLYTLQGRLKTSLAADQIMLFGRYAVQADADPRYAGGSNLICHLRGDQCSIAGQRDAQAQRYAVTCYQEDIGPQQGLAAA